MPFANRVTIPPWIDTVGFPLVGTKFRWQLARIRWFCKEKLSAKPGPQSIIEPVVLSRPDSKAAKAFLQLAENCHNFLNPEQSLKAG